MRPHGEVAADVVAADGKSAVARALDLVGRRAEVNVRAAAVVEVWQLVGLCASLIEVGPGRVRGGVRAAVPPPLAGP